MPVAGRFAVRRLIAEQSTTSGRRKVTSAMQKVNPQRHWSAVLKKGPVLQ